MPMVYLRNSSAVRGGEILAESAFGLERVASTTPTVTVKTDS